MIDYKKIGNTLILALLEAHKVHNELGLKGLEEVQNNKYGDKALRVDVECEAAVINFLKGISFPLRMYSEEHETADITPAPRYTGVMDGCDGTSKYKEAPGVGRYSTMFAIYEGLNPSYDNYIVCGICEHATKKIYFAIKGQGAYEIDIETMARKRIYAAKLRVLIEPVIYIDEYWEFCRNLYSAKMQQFAIPGRSFCTMSSTIYYVDLVRGDAHLVLDCSHKGNLEIAVSYGIIREAGGVVVDLKGISIGKRKYLEYGQKDNEPEVFISGCTLELTLRAVEYLEK